MAAMIGLVGSATTGYLMDVKLKNNVGILVTLVVAAFLSNLQLVPTMHPLYDLCWTTFLPASLALLLLSSKKDTGRTSADASYDKNYILQTIRLVAVPFVIGSIGSVVGCLASFGACYKYPNTWLSPLQATICAGCLCASYIGGSVNFFATANFFSSEKTLLSSMATADLVVMALYFCLLAAAPKSRMLVKRFAQSNNTTREEEEENSTMLTTDDRDCNTDTQPSGMSNSGGIASSVRAVTIASSLALGIVWIANRFEAMASKYIPGTACAVIALLSVWIQRLLPHKDWCREMQSVAAPMSELSFHLLFASIGTCANMGQALRYGPACLVFSFLALLLHIVIILAGSMLVQSTVLKKLQLDHVLIASNAAIGGPATAAAFAGRIESKQQKGLVMAATTWGVVGYAVATAIGITLTRILQKQI